MTSFALRYLDRTDVVAAGGMDFEAAIADVRAGFAMLRAGDATMPSETSVALDMEGATDARSYALPAALGAPYDSVGVKWTTHRAASAGPPRIVSLTMVNDRRTGAPVGIVESAVLTAMRTAAVSALALRHAAPRPVRRVALLGAGTQATTHLAMLAASFPGLEQVALWNRTPAACEAMVQGAGVLPWPVVRSTVLVDALVGSDAVLACTAATSPILDADAAQPGRIVLQIGYHEASFALIATSTAVVVDLWGEFRNTSAKSLFQAHRAGRFAADRLAAQLAEVLEGQWAARPDDAVYFSSFGLNVFDLALATRVLRRAAALGLGRTLDLFGKEIPR